jgi:hypothetical protein
MTMLARTIILALLLGGCASLSTDSGGTRRLADYHRAYIKPLVEDEFSLRHALTWELRDMGISVVSEAPPDPRDGDMVVEYDYSGGWDMTRYLKTFQFQFIDAKTKEVFTSQSYSSSGIWRGRRDGRLVAAFNELRKRNNLPPTKQFGASE